ncbi:MAG: NAD-dependent epimerase/dehydratase family protein [Stellaceae bacterium]
MAESGSAAPVVVTGAGGFIGRALVERLAARGTPVIAVLRHAAALPEGAAPRLLGELTAATDWSALLAGARAVVHLASRAHAPASDEQCWIESEAAAGGALARQARSAGVARLVLLSSIKVLGERTQDLPLRAHQPPAPADVYGLAKWRLEEAMRAEAGEALAILRPPLVYGPRVKANFLALLRLVDSGLPLPLAAIDNRRSLVFLDNLLDLVETALVHPAAAGETFLLRDAEEVSTAELARRIAEALGRRPRLFACPPAPLRLAASLVGRAGAADRLLSSLRVDDLATRQRLGWRPRVTLADGLGATARWYRGRQR